MIKIQEAEVEIPATTKRIKIKETRICNKCGEEFYWICQDHPNNYLDFSKIKNFKIEFIYDSSINSDKWNFHLCDNCLLELVKTFKYVPEGFYNYYGEYDELQRKFEKWKKLGIWEYEEDNEEELEI